MDIQYKGFTDGLIVKDVDAKTGTVTGYFSVFGNIDSDGDMIMPGAFLKTIKENGPEAKNRIVHLWQHNPSQPIGKPSLLKEDTYGLYFESKLADTSLGKDTLKLYEAGIINEHSIGFNTVKKETKSDHTALLELKLWEGSSVTWGANEMARATGLKSLTPVQLQEKKQTIYKALRNGSFEDGTFELLIKQLEYLDSIETIQPEVKQPTTEPDEKQSILLYTHLLTKKMGI
jgi:HK97 family phage prohead protease